MVSGAEIVIDLGDGWRDQPLPADRPSRTVPRPGIAAVVALATVLGVGASAAPPPAPLTEVAVVAGQSGWLAIHGDTLLIQPDRAITAYDVTTGTRRWTLDPGNVAVGAGWELTSRWLLMSWQDPDPASSAGPPDLPGDGPVPQTVAIDLMTGARHWHGEGWPMQLPGNTVLFTREGGVGRPMDFRNLDTFDLRWSMPQPFAYEADPGRIAIHALGRDGVFTERDLTTGAVRRTGSLPPPAGDFAWVSIVDDRLLVRVGTSPVFDEMPGSKEFWYDLASLTPSAPPEWPFLIDCGPVWCGQHTLDEQTAPSVLDRQTKKVRWTLPARGYLISTVAGLVFIDTTRSATGDPVKAILDERTGAVLHDLSGWQMVREDSATIQALMRPNIKAGTTDLALLTPSGLRMLGVLPYISPGCVSGGHTIACRDVAGQVHLLRFS
jgi:hypothetical protein